jgi:uncharacterized protein YndB with AHSA1/START domain
MNALKVNVSRLIRAAPDDVFRAWLDPERLQRWFGTSRQIVNPKVDGLFYLAMQHEERLWPHYGRYLRIEKPRLIEFTWMSEGTEGRETVVTIEMVGRDGGTQLTLNHAGVPDTALGRGHEAGWTAIVAEFAKALE